MRDPRSTQTSRWRTLCCALILLAWSAQAFSTATAAKETPGRDRWSFQPIHKITPPASTDPWCLNEIDRFILAKLNEKGLKPAPTADRQTLIRRASFDLIGLPPTPREVEAFEKDMAPDAFAKVVDRLLASPQYGERWGRYWLDLARYADDEGNSFLTPSPHAYVYRDWVIRALNRDIPYNQFLRLQLAGDLIPEPTTDYVERLGGLGFQGLGPTFRKGAAGEAKAKADELEDRVDTLSRGILALTVACARCHDHKFDPIPTREYYSLAAAYNGAEWSTRILGSPEAVAEVQKRQEEAKKQKERIEKWPAEEARRLGRAELARLDAYLMAAWEIRAARQQKLAADESAIARRENLRLYFLNRLVSALDSKHSLTSLADWRACADQAASCHYATGETLHAPDDLGEKTRSVLAKVTQSLAALDGGNQPKDQPALAGAAPAGPDTTQQVILKELWQNAAAPFALTAGDVDQMLSDSDRKELAAQKAELARLETPPPNEPPQCPSVSGGGETMHVFVRGNPEKLGEEARPGFLSILQPEPRSPESGKRFTRLDLADAIIDPKNPLTARVFVNRVWHYHFGRGIVSTLGNFGARGEPPTHPELLDTLAATFMENGWSIKWLHRQIMLSRTYQLSGTANADNLAKDADNRFLWRYSTRRLDVEAWRDAMLAVAGRLNLQMGGPALDPKEPGEHMPGFPAIIRLRGLFADDPSNGRRTVYCIVSRYAPTLTLSMFDFPEPNVASDHRNVTTIPQQQLFVLNSPFMLAMSRSFAARLASTESSDDGRLGLAWRLAYGRQVTPEESSRCYAFLQLPPDVGDKLSRWEQLCQAILSSNEFAFLP